MAERRAAASFAALITAASRYVEGGFGLAKLGPGEAQRLRLLNLPSQVPPAAGSGSWQNLWLGSWDGLAGVGIVGNYEDLQLLVHNYGPEATDTYFPFPKKLSKHRERGDGQLLFTITPEGLRRAAGETIGMAVWDEPRANLRFASRVDFPNH
jgi:hypothetical protein